MIRPVRFGDQGLDELALGWGVPGLDQISKAPVGGAVIVTLSKEKGCFDYLLLIGFAAKVELNSNRTLKKESYCPFPLLWRCPRGDEKAKGGRNKE